MARNNLEEFYNVDPEGNGEEIKFVWTERDQELFIKQFHFMRERLGINQFADKNQTALRKTLENDVQVSVDEMFQRIKKQNGEKAAQALRTQDSSFMDIEGLDYILKYAGREMEPLFPYLTGLKKLTKEEGPDLDPIVLLDKAGYDAFYVDSLEKQNSIRPYFASGEEICTLRDPNRFRMNHIIHAVKKNASDLKREDFKNPRREDEYGRSVISIQINKLTGNIKITNRYNHTDRKSVV